MSRLASALVLACVIALAQADNLLSLMRCSLEQDTPSFDLEPGKIVNISASTVNATAYTARFTYNFDGTHFPRIRSIERSLQSRELGIMVAQPCGVSVYGLPTRLSRSCSVDHFAQTLCPDVRCIPTPVGQFQLTVTSLLVVTADLYVELVDLDLPLDSQKQVSASAAQPSFVKVRMIPNIMCVSLTIWPSV